MFCSYENNDDNESISLLLSIGDGSCFTPLATRRQLENDELVLDLFHVTFPPILRHTIEPPLPEHLAAENLPSERLRAEHQMNRSVPSKLYVTAKSDR